MDELPQALLFLGIIPALIIMYISLKGYDELYKEKTVFLIFIYGIYLAIKDKENFSKGDIENEI